MRVRALVLVLVLAGCLAKPDAVPDAPSPEDVARIFETAIVQDHDHTDATLHTGHYGLEFVAWEPLIPEEIGTEGFAGMRVLDGVAYIATDGAHAGFLTVDVTDPRAPKLLGQYTTPGGASQEAVPTPDGNWVFLNLQRAPGAMDLVADPARGHGNGIQIVDVSDKTAPRFESFVPVEVRGTHVMYFHEQGGRPLLYYNGQPSGAPVTGQGVVTAPPGNVVKIAEFTEVAGRRTLVPVGEFRYEGCAARPTGEGCFPHDMWVEKHPETGRETMYVAHWDGGLVIVDVEDPARPTLLSVYDDPAPSTKNSVHFARPDPTPRDGRAIVWTGPEIATSPGETGYFRAMDVTDPAAPAQLGVWTLPSPVEIDQGFVFSPHNFEFRGDLMALAHYHAGVWVLDVSDPAAPETLAYYLPHGDPERPFEGDVWRKTPNFPEPWLPNVYEVRWLDGVDGETYLLLTERGTGLYVLRLAPDIDARYVG